MENNKKVLLFLAGKQGSGKSVIAEYITEAFPGSISIKISAVLVETLNLWGVTASATHMQRLSDFMRSTFGKDTLANIIKSRIDTAKANVIVVDGVRGFEVPNLLRSAYTGYVIYIECNQNMRFERIKARNEKVSDKQLTEKLFLHTEQHRTEMRVEDLKSVADLVVKNEDTLAAVQHQVFGFIDEKVAR